MSELSSSIGRMKAAARQGDVETMRNILDGPMKSFCFDPTAPVPNAIAFLR
jgi:hypothetical protein